MTNSEAPEQLRGLAAIAEILRKDKSKGQGLGPHRRYVLERVDGELVFRQPEVDALLEDAINEIYDKLPPAGRHVIKLP